MASYAALKSRVEHLVKQGDGALTFEQAFKLSEQKHRCRSAIKRKIRHHNQLIPKELRDKPKKDKKDNPIVVNHTTNADKFRELKAILAKLQPLAPHREEFLASHPNTGKKKAKEILPVV